MFLRRAYVGLPLSRRLLSTNSVNNHLDISATIAELNKEMESVFGQPPTGLAGSINNDHTLPEPDFKSHSIASSFGNETMVQEEEDHRLSKRVSHNVHGLTHVGSAGEAQMVDVSPKEASKRTAIASCKVILGRKVFEMVLANQMTKGDVLTVAKIAGINGAKQTSSLIPLCHNITLSHVRVDLRLNPENYSVEIQGEASSTEKTGVEMEAMTSVTVAGLTVYDMCKAASKEIQLTDVRLERKIGGKSGDWSRYPPTTPQRLGGAIPACPSGREPVRGYSGYPSRPCQSRHPFSARTSYTSYPFDSPGQARRCVLAGAALD